MFFKHELIFYIFINVFTVQVCLKCRHNVNTGILWIQEYYEYRHVNYNYRRIINTNILYYKYNHKWVQIHQEIIIEKSIDKIKKR